MKAGFSHLRPRGWPRESTPRNFAESEINCLAEARDLIHRLAADVRHRREDAGHTRRIARAIARVAGETRSAGAALTAARARSPRLVRMILAHPAAPAGRRDAAGCHGKSPRRAATAICPACPRRRRRRSERRGRREARYSTPAVLFTAPAAAQSLFRSRDLFNFDRVWRDRDVRGQRSDTGAMVPSSI